MDETATGKRRYGSRVQLVTYVDAETNEAITTIAERRGRSVAAELRRAIAQHVKKAERKRDAA